jgi:uncharacterized membrane protein YfcA
VSVVAAMAFGVAGGLMAGLVGIGGGVLFVPALAVFLDQSQLEAEATSLLAIVPVALVGAWRQARFQNVRIVDGIALGALSLLGVIGGAVLANTVSQRTLEIAFAILTLVVAFGLVRRALGPVKEGEPSAVQD